MDFDDFANPSKPLLRVAYKSGEVRGCMETNNIEDEDVLSPRIEENFDYAVDYQRKEVDHYIDCHKKFLQMNLRPGTSTPQMEQVEDIPSCVALSDILERNVEEMTGIYRKYTFKHCLRTALIVDNFKDKILGMININNVVIIQGHTGCGKSTQVPQFILDNCRANNRVCNVIVTQPRRIAAISVAQRVCTERAWTLGSVCGYRVGLDSCTSNDTILTYVTTGVLLQKLIKAKHMNEFTHVIIDEVHERSQDMDFLLVIIRKYLYTVSRNVKVILMSATFNAEEFSTYFHSVSGNKLEPAPIIYVGKENTKHKTQIFYINQLEKLGEIPQFEQSQPRIPECVYKLFVHLIRTFDHTDPINVDFSDVSNPQGREKKRRIGHVLVFLPGILEIEEAYEQLKAGVNKRLYQNEDETNKIKWLMLPLHSSITREEQRKIFDAPPEGMRKIILSTNIAESSITVPDICYVVDFCLTKTMIADQITQYPSLHLEWATHTNCTQRAGRVGRVDDGRVYRMVPQDFYEHQLRKDITPEILRAPLEQLVLYSKILDINEPPKAILALCLNPPNLSNIVNTINSLKEIGGLLLTVDGKYSTSDGDLTYLGRIMAKLPLNVRLSKFIVLGHFFGCLNQCIIMAAGLSIQNIFSTPFQERLKAYKNKLLWADGSSSDLIAYLNLYLVWERYRSDGSFTHAQSERNWAAQNYLNYRLLKDWSMLVDEIKQRLKYESIVELVGQHRFKLNFSVESLILKIIMCGAFYPNYFVRSCDGGQVDEREAVKTLGGRDPYSTVYLTNFDNKQPGPLYAKRIKELMKSCGTEMTVSFDNSSKVFIQFIPNNEPESIRVANRMFLTTMPGKVAKEVYIACRNRQLRNKMSLPVLKSEEAWERAKELGITQNGIGDKIHTLLNTNPIKTNNSVIPALDISHVQIRVSNVSDAAHFWAQNVDVQTDRNMHTLDQLLNSGSLKEVQEKIKVGGLYAGPFAENSKETPRYYRAKVVSLTRIGKNREDVARIIFVDYGNNMTINIHQLKALPEGLAVEMEAQAMECILTAVQPSLVQGRALWTEAAISFFQQLTNNTRVYGKVYSVVNGVVSMELFQIMNYRGKETTATKSVNQTLIEKGYGQKSEESFLSRDNHEKRMQIQESMERVSSDVLCEQIRNDYIEDVEAPDPIECRRTLDLRGPFSPLETKIYSLVQSGFKQCNIDGTSVNAVLLDTEPHDPHERLLVAETIGQNVGGTCLNLRHTTLMPNIHGFPMIMSLLFCPKMEPKPVADGTRFGAVLCGLGYDTNDGGRCRPIYPQHDFVVHTDTKLSLDVVEKINIIRHYLNTAVQLLQDISEERQSPLKMFELQTHIHKTLMELLKKEPISLERTSVKDAKVWGKMEFDGIILDSVHEPTGSEIWPLHWTIQLNDEDEESIKIRYNLAQLNSMSRREIDFTKISCILCSVEFYNLAGIRVHLPSQQHIEKLIGFDKLKRT